MLRLVLLVFAVFLLLTVLRGLRIFLAAVLRRAGPGGPARTGAVSGGEMVRDPVCGIWIDRRLALGARRGSDSVAVCSEKCRKALEGP